MSFEYVRTSVSAMPSAMPPSRVSGNELNPPISATGEGRDRHDDREHGQAQPGVGCEQDAGETRRSRRRSPT